MAQTDTRRRIRQLQAQIDSLNAEQDELRRRMTRDSQERMWQMTEELRCIDASSVGRIRQMREEIAAEMQRNVDAIRRAGQQSQERRTRLFEQLQRTSRELQEEADRLRQEQTRRQEAGRGTAERLIQRARAQAGTVEAEPHNFFCPNQFEVLQEHLASAVRMLEMGLYDAASAMADAAWTELELLGIQVRERQWEWEQIYQIYDVIATGLYRAMTAFEAEAIQTPLGAFILEDEDRAYWSREQYQPIRNKVAEAYRLVEDIRAAGSVTAYLRSHTALRGFALNNQVNGLRRLNEQLTAATLCIRSELTYSDQRCQMAERMSVLLGAMGYQVRESKFRGEPEDLLDCYDLTVTINGIDMMTLTFVPQREDGVVVRNICIVAPNVKTLPNPELVRGEAQALIGAVQQELAGIKAAWYPADSMQLPAVEQQFKRQPDPQQLARKLERKYQ